MPKTKEEVENDLHNEELMKWSVEQIVRMHGTAGLIVEKITPEAQKLFDFVDNAGPTKAGK